MSSPSDNTDFCKAIEQLRLAFIARLPEEYQTVETALQSLTANRSEQATLEALHQMFHKLAGSSGTFGLSQLGIKAKVVEQQIKAWKKQQYFSLTSSEIELLRQLFEDVKLAESVKDEESGIQINLSKKEVSQDEFSTLWLIEEDQVIAKELVKQFETFGYRVTLFDSLKSANSAADNEQPHALLLDLMFDDGKINVIEDYSQCKSLRKLDCPLMVISANDDFSHRIRAVQLNARGYFLKPISIPDIVNHLRRIFEEDVNPGAHILIVEDDQELAKHYQLVLESAGFKAKCLFDTEKIMQEVRTFNPEVVLMDLHMPKYSGMELAGVIRQHEQWMSLPILYLSGETDISARAEALEKGVEDFLTKPILDSQLISTLKARVIRSRQLDERISRDGLTGLLKHSVIKEIVMQEVSRSKRTDKPSTVVMLDIDKFKLVNDTYGHAVGDIVISSIATVLQQRLRKTDLIGRYGGEEFVAVLPDCDIKKGKKIIDGIRESFHKIEFNHEDKKFSCSFSAGLICTEDFKDLDGEEVLIAADASLYHSKKNGRNQITCANDIMQNGES